MKIALCLSGQPRFIDTTYPLLKSNVLEQNDCDIFFHTWYDQGKVYDGTYWSPIITPSDDIPTKLLELYQPKKWIIEPNRNEQFKQESVNIVKNTEAEPYITKSMFYTIKQSHELKLLYEKETCVQYDVVMRMRFDVAILTPIKINLSKNTVNFIDVIRNPSVACDWCFWGDPETMQKCMTVYDCIPEYATEGVQICGESLLQHKLDKNGITKTPHPISGILARDADLNDKSWGRIY
jgi:hypothetical protein